VVVALELLFFLTVSFTSLVDVDVRLLSVLLEATIHMMLGLLLAVN